jgi:Na+-translocating ferredoxin:NAD+ oxidoreductase subunit G
MSIGTRRWERFGRLFIPLSVIFLACTVLLYVTDKITRARITENSRIMELRIIDTVMPLGHDNDLHDDYIEVSDPDYLGSNSNVTLFRARRAALPVGVVFMPVTARGYSGNIQLVIGVAYDGTLLGVRILKHQETQGLGDRIEHTKSAWINNFTGRSFAGIPPVDWTVQADGGRFDQLSGATITSRGVVNAVRKALEYYNANRDRVYLDNTQQISR